MKTLCFFLADSEVWNTAKFGLHVFCFVIFFFLCPFNVNCCMKFDFKTEFADFLDGGLRHGCVEGMVEIVW